MSNFTTSWVSLQEKLKEIIQAEREIPGTPQTTQKNKTTSNHNTGSFYYSNIKLKLKPKFTELVRVHTTLSLVMLLDFILKISSIKNDSFTSSPRLGTMKKMSQKDCKNQISCRTVGTSIFLVWQNHEPMNSQEALAAYSRPTEDKFTQYSSTAGQKGLETSPLTEANG